MLVGLITGRINICHIKNKFDLLIEQIRGDADLSMITETKINKWFFPNGQFFISVTFRSDRDKYGGGIMLFF